MQQRMAGVAAMRQFGRGKPRLGGLSVEKTGAKKAAAQKERLLRGAETCWRRKADQE